MAHTWMSHGTYIHESWHCLELRQELNKHVLTWLGAYIHDFMAHIWMRHGTHIKESWHRHTTSSSDKSFIHPYECGMVHTYMCHGTHLDASWHTHGLVMAHT